MKNLLGVHELRREIMSEYVMNMETQKLELHFEKADYMALSEELKKEIKSNFLFSRKAGAWISRAKFPNLWYAETVAKKIGLTDGGKSGETLTFAEQMERKTKKAEARAERYDHKSENARDKAVALQKPINDMHGDVAFFTQPNINSSSGHAFTNRRNRMFAAWERGFDEFKKSEYYAERAEAARQTAAETKPTDKGFIIRRIKEAEKTIRAQKKNLESYRKTLEQIKQGKTFKRYNGTPITADTVQKWIEDAELIIENAISKSIYYHECLEKVGGVAFSKDNIKAGYIVKIKRWGNCKVIGTGRVNITYEVMNVPGGVPLKAAYAEIESIVSDTVQIDQHPFKVGESYTVQVWSNEERKIIDKEYTVTKITEEKVTIKSGTDRAITKKPRKFRDGKGYCWAIGVADGIGGTIYKKSPEGSSSDQHSTL